jgi:rod shape determining protein RodA
MSITRPPGLRQDRGGIGRLRGGVGGRYGRLAPVRPPRGIRDSRGLGALLRMPFSRKSPLRQLDWVLLGAVTALSASGVVLVWSASGSAASARSYVVKQLMAIVLGLILMVVISGIGYRRLRQYAPFLYGASVLGLLAVLSPLGRTINGGREWLSLPAGFNVEPSEFAKLGIILMCAMILGDLRGTDTRPRLRAVARALACGGIPLLLVVAEPDLGGAILMLTIVAGLIALSGVRLRWLAALAGTGVAGVLAVLNLHLLKPYQAERLTSFLHPTADPTGSGWQALQARIAVGTGGLYGQGLFHGQMVAGHFLGAEQQSDFIFASAAEQLGFAGAIMIIGLLAVVLLRALRIAARADDQFGMLVAAGVAIWFAFQAFINIGMTVGLMPVTGLPLPFVSYGGSAMLVDMVAVGALQAVHRHQFLFAG